MKRLSSLTFVALACLLLTLALAACGDTPAATAPAATITPAPTAAPAVPTYPGATALPQLDELKTVYQTAQEQWKNAKVDTYKSQDTADQIKSGLTEAFKKNGWVDDSALLAKNNATFSANGGFYTGFHNGNQYVTLIGLPVASIGDSIQQLNNSTTLFLVVVGEKP